MTQTHALFTCVTSICLTIALTSAILPAPPEEAVVTSHKNTGNNEHGEDKRGERLYHKTHDLIQEIRELCASCAHADAEWTTVTTTASTWQPEDDMPRRGDGALLTVTLTADAKARNHHRRQGRAVARRTTVVAAFGEHGRERITSELALHLLRGACRASAAMPVYLATAELVLLPVVNVVGRQRAESGHECQRFNANGVDVNRNYRRDFGRRDADTNDEEEESGPFALSEMETRVTDAVVRRVSADAYISVHSGDRALITPWDGRNAQTHAQQARADAMAGLARDLATHYCDSRCAVGRAVDTLRYRAFGTGTDHMADERGVPFALTLEVYGGGEDESCALLFNPQSSRAFARVLADWADVLRGVVVGVRAHGLTRGDTVGVRVDRVDVAGGWLRTGYSVRWVPDATRESRYSGDGHDSDDDSDDDRDGDSNTAGTNWRAVGALGLAGVTVRSLWMVARRAQMRRNKLRRVGMQ